MNDPDSKSCFKLFPELIFCVIETGRCLTGSFLVTRHLEEHRVRENLSYRMLKSRRNPLAFTLLRCLRPRNKATGWPGRYFLNFARSLCYPKAYFCLYVACNRKILLYFHKKMEGPNFYLTFSLLWRATIRGLAI